MLSVVIITKNEEKNLERALRSVSWADEIVVVDSKSEDNTLSIARRFNAKIVSIEWSGFGHAKGEGVREAKGNWILSLDADEEVTVELMKEIQQTLQSPEHRGYMIPRRTSFLGRWIYHCGWYPDPVLRLFEKQYGTFTDSAVHEKVEVSGKVGRLKSDLLHYSYPTLESYFIKFNRYTTLGAQEAFRQGGRGTVYDIVMRPIACFVKHYLIRRGFLDGTEGFIISVFSSCYVLAKYAKVRDLRRQVNQSAVGTVE
ncbi:MAG: glycosyltransferase family 2 protein [candidate division Zixibacteria bacterium]|nr:glycosyltransferase family 2 protein [candidate division Zixibacteria bacterium]